MALSVLDGNQSATTLSSVVTGGEHIVAHSVVSLGSNAISNITTAVSGSVVTIPNLNVLARSVATEGITDGTLNFVKIGGHQDGSNQTAHIVHVSGGGAMKVDASDSTVTFGEIRGTVTIGNTVTIAGTVTANPTGTQTIAGTVTANGGDFSSSNTAQPTSKIQIGFQGIGGDFTAVNEDGYPFPVNVFIDGTRVQSSNPIPISGTVTVGNTVNFLSGSDNDANLIENIASAMSQNNILGITNALPTGTNRIGVVTIGGGTVTIGAGTSQIGSVTASISNSVTIASLPAISGTVTANSSNGSLTTRFGSVTTANTAFATSAVTNANRKYLLIQNVTTASNVITVGIGFTPTTTQGIQLSSGAGLTFEGSYIPTGAVNLLSSVTASCFTILEA